MLLTDRVVDSGDFARRTGWEIKPEGACKGDVCVPLPDDVGAGAGRIDVEAIAARLGMPLVRHDGTDLWSLGPETAPTGRALTTAVAPDLTLPDANGRPFSLSSLRGQKVVMVAWASW
jgi:hypothetical protein